MSHVEIEGVKLEFQVLHLIYKLNGIGNMGFFFIILFFIPDDYNVASFDL